MERSTESDLLYLTFMKDGKPILEMDFSVEGMGYDSVLLSGFMSAIQEFSKKFAERDVKQIDQGDLKVFLEEGDKTSAIYVASVESEELRLKIQSLLESFELRYKETLEDKKKGVSPQLFENFKENITQTLSEDVIRPHYVVSFTGQPPKHLLSEDAWPIIAHTDGKRTVAQVATHSGTNLQFVMENLAILKSKGLVQFRLVMDAYDIPILTPKGTTKLVESAKDYQILRSKFGDTIFDVIKAIDSRTPVARLAEKLSIGISDAKDLLKSLITKGYIDLLDEELKYWLVVDQFYLNLKAVVTKVLGKKGLQIVSRALDKEKSPLVKLVTITEDSRSPLERVKYHIEGQQNVNLKQVMEPFLFAALRVFQSLEAQQGKKYTNKLKTEILNVLKNQFGPTNVAEIERILA